MFVGITASIIATLIIAYIIKSKFWIQLQLKRYVSKLIYQIENHNDFEKENGYEYISIISDFDIASHFTQPTAVEYLFDNEEYQQSSVKVYENVENTITEW
ncbi:MAG: hypothetical protein JEZ12_23865 [Desulfobacterium sp.]|nr:hypothetical protein [Desulfobacterium sp.]